MQCTVYFWLSIHLFFCLDIQEYLLLKGVEAVAIHGSKSMYFALSFMISPV